MPSDAVGVMIEDNLGANSLLINNNSFTSMGLGVKNVVAGTFPDATNNWWGHNSGPLDASDDTPTGLYNPSGMGVPVTDGVNYYPWLGGNVYFTPDPALISLADGPAYTEDLTCSYAGGATGLLYAYSIDVTWNPAVITAGTGDFTKPAVGGFADAQIFLKFPITNGVRIVAAFGGDDPGIASGPLFDATVHAVGTPDYSTSPLTLALTYMRDIGNTDLTGFLADHGEVIVDLLGPVVSGTTITNATDMTETCINNGDAATVEATITDASITAAGITADLSGLGGGSAVNPDSYSAGTATWTLASVTCTPADGPVTVTVTATDGGSNTGSDSDDITADNTAPAQVTDLDATPEYHTVNLTWSDVTGNTGYYLYRSKRAGYPYPGALPGEGVYPGSYTLAATLGADDTAYSDDFGSDVLGDRGVYDYKIVAFDCPKNQSLASATASATNYFLGDWAGYDGIVFTTDLGLLSAAYGTSTGHPSFNPLVDVGPTA
ncbi:MAG: hypothetical protein KDC54_03680, partial [Lewinella sp.]|nr:hypothetical protein [Lewinella sp.]